MRKCKPCSCPYALCMDREMAGKPEEIDVFVYRSKTTGKVIKSAARSHIAVYSTKPTVSNQRAMEHQYKMDLELTPAKLIIEVHK